MARNSSPRRRCVSTSWARVAREVPKPLDALDLNAGRAGIGDRVVLRLACAASVGSERRPRGQPEGGEV
jgi:hypothetical protein